MCPRHAIHCAHHRPHAQRCLATDQASRPPARPPRRSVVLAPSRRRSPALRRPACTAPPRRWPCPPALRLPAVGLHCAALPPVTPPGLLRQASSFPRPTFLAHLLLPEGAPSSLQPARSGGGRSSGRQQRWQSRNIRRRLELGVSPAAGRGLANGWQRSYRRWGRWPEAERVASGQPVWS
jgi:hypothetical protein